MKLHYRKPSVRESVLQIATSAVPLAILWLLMFLSLEHSYWITILLALPAAGFLVRLFIIQHDCGHHSFFTFSSMNDAVGFLIGILTLTPYQYWRRCHALHHAGSGNLDRRGHGDITTLTVREYLGLSKWERSQYRLYRNPFAMLIIGAIYQFLIKQRFPCIAPVSWERERTGIVWTNIGIFVVIIAMSSAVGLWNFLLIQTPITILASAFGIWLFYVQHQFHDAYWQRNDSWEFEEASFKGSSYLLLPPVLRWISGNIGIHHVHHLNSKIPNYRLQECLENHEVLQQANRITLREGLKCFSLKLWDEERKKMVGYPQ